MKKLIFISLMTLLSLTSLNTYCQSDDPIYSDPQRNVSSKIQIITGLSKDDKVKVIINDDPTKAGDG